MAFFTLLGISFVGSVVWLLNAEATAAYYGADMGWHPVAVGLTCATGQVVMYVILYFGGAKLVERWRWLAAKVQRAEERYGDRLHKAYVPTTLVAALFGIPPVLAMVSLAAGFHIRLRTIVAVTFVGRFVRFTFLAAVGQMLFVWWASF
jgi:membrane protein YqaA with SNARE-associated domain